MDGWMDGYLNGWMDGWVYEWMDGWMGIWMDGWMDRYMNGWMDGWMDGYMNGWMDGWVNARRLSKPNNPPLYRLAVDSQQNIQHINMNFTEYAQHGYTPPNMHKIDMHYSRIHRDST